MSSFIWLLAQTIAPPTTGPQPPAWYQFVHGGTFPLVVIMCVLWLFVFRNKNPKDSGVNDRLKDLKRGDRIQTIGGILGTVVEARENEVVVKVDESNNTKMKFTRGAISKVVEEEKAAGK